MLQQATKDKLMNLLWRFHGKLFTTFTMRRVDVLSRLCQSSDRQGKVFEHFRHTTGRMDIIMTGRDNRFFREVISRSLKVEVIIRTKAD